MTDAMKEELCKKTTSALLTFLSGELELLVLGLEQ